MEIVATCSSSFATEVAKVVPIKRHVSYILDRQKNLEDFKKKAKQLEDERESVKHAVEAAERNGEKIELGVRKWLISVDQKIKEYDEKVRALEDKAKERCFNGLCPNVKFYYRLGKKAQEHAKVVAELLQQGRFDRISYRPAPEGIGTMSNNYYEAFQSRGSILEGIMENLRDPILKMIGVYGMPGVGKTMLVKEVARKVREEYLFDEVVMATITHNPNITNIQGEIADMLGLRFDEESESGRAMRLRQRLRSDKKVLVILDDVWAKLDLDAIGISLEDDKNIAPDENEGSIMQNIAPDENQRSIMQNIDGSSLEKVSTVKSKILLTSRNLDVLCRMDAEKKFECRILSREEAMTLFVRIVGDVVHNPSYKPIANQVVEKCAGLPVAVSTIANTLKGMNLDIWENALRQLKRSNATNIEGMEEGVYSIIELSYERLKEEAQSLFRLCALYRQGSDIPIRNYLLRHNLGLDLLEGVRTLEEARKSVSDLVHKLKSSSLLLSGCNDEFVKMHDIVRDVSISIASQENQMFVIEEGIRMKDLLKKGKLNNCTALSLPYGDIHQELPKVLECPKLKLFLLTEDDDRQSEVPDTFFEKMNDLQVLQLNGMRFPSLPSSFLSLTNLQTLCLDFCALSDIALIANLKKLDILSLCSSKIKQLPNEIAQLTQLRLLDLSNCFKLEVIPANILSSLTCLEELHMGNSFNRWDVEGNASLVELKNLDRLTTLDVHIRDAQSLPKDLFSETKLERYKIFVGEALWDWFDKHKYSRTLKLMPNTRINWDRGIRMLLTRTEDLYVNEVQGVKSSLHELGETGFPHLKNVHVENNSEIQYIINSIRGISCEAFPLLESLFLHNLSNLKNISHAQIYVECFRSLKIIKVINCDSLKNLFSFSLAEKLFQLQEIEVTDCKNIVDIIGADRERDNEATDQIELRELRSITLQCLPQLINFRFQEKKHSTTSSIASPLFTGKITPQLEEVSFSSDDIALICDGQFASHFFCHIKLLQITCYLDESAVLPVFFLQKFYNLEMLQVFGCNFKELSPYQGNFSEDKEVRMLSKLRKELKHVELHCLPSLGSFCSGNSSFKFPSLEQVIVSQCPRLKSFCLGALSTPKLQRVQLESTDYKGRWAGDLGATVEHLHQEKVGYQCLKHLKLSEFPELVDIWNGNPQEILDLKNLEFLEFCNSVNLGCIFNLSMALSLVRLQQLEIKKCNKMEAVIKEDGSVLDQRARTDKIIIFPCLKSIFIEHCPDLTSFYWGSPILMECPSLKIIEVAHCPNMTTFVSIFPRDEEKNARIGDGTERKEDDLEILPAFFCDKVVFPNLEKMTISHLRNMKRLWFNQFHADSFCKMKELEVEYCDELLNIFPSFVLGVFQRLEMLRVTDCGSLEEVFELRAQGLEIKDTCVVAFQLKEMRLFRLPKLKHVWNKDPQGNISFQTLRIVDVWECWSLKSLFPFSIAKGLPQLERLIVQECGVEEIVSKNEGLEQEIGFEFNHLSFIKLWILRSLKCFYPGKHTIVWPVLKNLKTHGCGEIKIFGQLESHIQQSLFVIEKITPQLEEVSFSSDDIALICDGQFASHFFCHIKLLQITCYLDESAVLPVFFLQKFYNLEMLQVFGCNFKELSPYQGNFSEDKEVRMLSKLRKELKHVELHCLPSLGSFCSGNSSFKFPSLEQVIVSQCPRLKSFCLGALSTPKLQRVQLESTDYKGRWAGDLGATVEHLHQEKVGYQCLKHLKLSEFPELVDIWNGNPQEILDLKNLEFLEFCNSVNLGCIFNLSMALSLVRLQQLEIKKCNKMEGVIKEDGSVLDQRARTDKIIIFPCLKSIFIEHCPDLTSFYWGSPILMECPSLKIIEVAHCPNMTTFVSIFPRDEEKNARIGDGTERKEDDLEILPAFFCDKHYLFKSPLIDQLSLLPLSSYRFKLRSLSSFIRHFSQRLCPLDHHSPSIQTLMVATPTCLFHLSPFSIPNKSETYSSPLILITSPCSSTKTAIYLSIPIHLKNLHIQNGLMIQYIIKHNDVDKIEFLQLHSLTLHGLPKLVSFCSGNNHSTSISPKELPLFNDKIMFPKLEKLKLSSISIERIWHYQIPGGSNSMQNLTSLIIEGCDNLKHILLYSMAECLQQLQIFEVIDCRCIQEIVAREEIKEDGKRATISFPLLTSLKLKGLPKLIGFCHENYFLEFPSLKILEIEHCLEIKGFINKSMSKDMTIGSTTEALFNEQVAFPNLERVTISHLRNVKRLWYNQLHADSFCKMKELKAEYCDELLNIFPSFVLEVFYKLEILRVTDCGSLEEVYELQAQGLEIKDTCVVAFQLKEMRLFRLPKLKHVWNKDPQGNISFQTLRIVDVLECWSLKSLFPFSIAKGLPQLERLIVQQCGVEEIVSKNEGLEQEIGFEFNHLSVIKLWILRSLKCFYPGKHTAMWPMLKKLRIYRCGKIKILGQLESLSQQPLMEK
ncbi:hypothetical protein POUND7_000818, partial [Theobroma cacao]